MQIIKDIFRIAITIALFVFAISTCGEVAQNETSVNHDTTIFNKLKAEHLVLQKAYEYKIACLQDQNDSLRGIVKEKKQVLLVTRFETQNLEDELRSYLIEKDSILPDTLATLTGAYMEAVSKNDSACDETILALEDQIKVQDSTLVIFDLSQNNLKSISHVQDLEIESLTENLNNALRTERKLKRRNRLLTIGITAVSAVSTTILIVNGRK